MINSSLLRGALVATLAALGTPVFAQQIARPVIATTASANAGATASTAAAVAAMAPQAAPGTFQLVQLSKKVKVALTTESLAEIESRRQDTQEVSWLLNSYARVRILPRSVINAPGFKPLPPVAAPAN